MGRTNAGNLSQQLGALGASLSQHVRRRWDESFADTCALMAAELEDAIADDVFAKQAEPSGKSWDAISPLTEKVREGTGAGGGKRLGGNKLPDSFKRGMRGSVFKVKGRSGFVFGSDLRGGGRHLVGRTFATDYKMPKNIDAKGGKGAKFYKRKLATQRGKAARIRAFMFAVTGIPAPAPGKQLHHPARKIVYWTRAWEQRCNKVIHNVLAVSFHRAKSDIRADVAAAQARFDAGRRTSVVG